MKKNLKYTETNKTYVESLPVIHIICQWASYGIRTEHVACYKYDKRLKRPIPYVYYWTDHNGEYEEYELIPYYWVTTGTVYDYTYSQTWANCVVEALNEHIAMQETLSQESNKSSNLAMFITTNFHHCPLPNNGDIECDGWGSSNCAECLMKYSDKLHTKEN